MREAEVLALQERVQQVDAGVDLADRRVDRPGGIRLLGEEPRQQFVQDGLVPMAPLDAGLIDRGR